MRQSEKYSLPVDIDLRVEIQMSITAVKLWSHFCRHHVDDVISGILQAMVCKHCVLVCMLHLHIYTNSDEHVPNYIW